MAETWPSSTHSGMAKASVAATLMAARPRPARRVAARMYSAITAGTGLAERATAATFTMATSVGRVHHHHNARLPMGPAATASGRGNGDHALGPSEPARVRYTLRTMAATVTHWGRRCSCSHAIGLTLRPLWPTVGRPMVDIRAPDHRLS